jgi:hypothetical protein
MVAFSASSVIVANEIRFPLVGKFDTKQNARGYAIMQRLAELIFEYRAEDVRGEVTLADIRAAEAFMQRWNEEDANAALLRVFSRYGGRVGPVSVTKDVFELKLSWLMSRMKAEVYQDRAESLSLMTPDSEYRTSVERFNVVTSI